MFPAGPRGTCLLALCSLVGAADAHLTKAPCVAWPGTVPWGAGLGAHPFPQPHRGARPPRPRTLLRLEEGGRGAPSPAWVAVTPATSVQVLLSWGGARTNRRRLREALGLWGALWWRRCPSLGAAYSPGHGQGCPRELSGAPTIPDPIQRGLQGGCRPRAVTDSQPRGTVGAGAGVYGQRCTPPRARAGPEQEGVCPLWRGGCRAACHLRGGGPQGGVPPTAVVVPAAFSPLTPGPFSPRAAAATVPSGQSYTPGAERSAQAPPWRASRPLRADVGVRAGVSGQRSQMATNGVAFDCREGAPQLLEAGSPEPPHWADPVSRLSPGPLPAPAGRRVPGRMAPGPLPLAAGSVGHVLVLLSRAPPSSSQPFLCPHGEYVVRSGVSPGPRP